MRSPCHFRFIVAALLAATLLPGLAKAASDYVKQVAQEIAPAGGQPVLLAGEDELAVLGRLQLREADAALMTKQIVDVAGQPFAKAARITMTKPASISWKASVQVRSTSPVKKGDVLWAIIHLRGGVPELGGSEAVASVVAKPGFPPYDPKRGLWGRRVDLNDTWTTLRVAAVAKEDLNADQLRFDLDIGFQRQWIEVGGYLAFNLGPNADLRRLPVTEDKPVTTYAGREPDAAWRAEAAERIRQHRQGELVVRVLDAQGRPVPDASVQATMTRNAFHFGVALDGWLYMADTPEGKVLPILHDGRWKIKHQEDPNTADAQRYRQEARRLFNTVVPENDLKADRLENGPLDREHSWRHAQAFVSRLRGEGFAVYGHVLVWPGWGNLPTAWRPLEQDRQRLRATVDAHVRKTVKLFGDDILAWDVVNEPYGNQSLQEIFGREILADWFRAARETNPTIGLHLNEAARPGTKQVEMRMSFHENLKMLQRLGAPMTGLGIQAHYGAPPSIEAIKAELDMYAEYGIDIWITEYDMYPPGGDETERERLEGDFTRDFLTLCYSHPAVKGFTMWGMWDGLHWKGRAPIFRKDWTLKPSGEAFIDLVHGQWKTQASMRTDADGICRARATLGEYEVSVTRSPGAAPEMFKAVVSKESGECVVRLP